MMPQRMDKWHNPYAWQIHGIPADWQDKTHDPASRMASAPHLWQLYIALQR